MKLIVGLGNPGVEYQSTRHNIGFSVVEELAKEVEVKFSERKFNSRIARRRLGRVRIILIKPYTYMNLSGKAVLSLMKWVKLDLDDLLVICDDVNLSFTTMRIKPGGSSGGHNGLKSIIDSLRTEDFSRLRLGVSPASPVRNEISPRANLEGKVRDKDHKELVFGKREKSLSEYVLGQFTPQEKELTGEFIERAALACRVWASRGIEVAMRKFNLRER